MPSRASSWDMNAMTGKPGPTSAAGPCSTSAEEKASAWMAEVSFNFSAASAATAKVAPRPNTKADLADATNSTIACGSLETEIDALKQGGDGAIIAHGGVRFWKSLIERDLIDEYRITVFPYLAGSGTRLFEDVTKSPRLDLVSAIPFKDGVLEVTCRRAR